MQRRWILDHETQFGGLAMEHLISGPIERSLERGEPRGMSVRCEDALIEGVLVRDGDCLFIGNGAPGERFAVLWPFGTTWDADAEEVVAADGTRIPVGSTLSAGGGYGSPEMLQRLLDDDDLRERADACAEGEYRDLAQVQHSISAK